MDLLSRHVTCRNETRRCDENDPRSMNYIDCRLSHLRRWQNWCYGRISGVDEECTRVVSTVSMTLKLLSGHEYDSTHELSIFRSLLLGRRANFSWTMMWTGLWGHLAYTKPICVDVLWLIPYSCSHLSTCLSAGYKFTCFVSSTYRACLNVIRAVLISCAPTYRQVSSDSHKCQADHHISDIRTISPTLEGYLSSQSTWPYDSFDSVWHKKFDWTREMNGGYQGMALTCADRDWPPRAGMQEHSSSHRFGMCNTWKVICWFSGG